MEVLIVCHANHLPMLTPIDDSERIESEAIWGDRLFIEREGHRIWMSPDDPRWPITRSGE